MLDLPNAGFTALTANRYAVLPVGLNSKLELQAERDPRNLQSYALIEAKNHAAAVTVLTALASEIPAPTVLYNLACVQALTGALDAAETALDQAITAGWLSSEHTAADPDLSALRSRPGWAGRLARIRANADKIEPPPSPRFTPLPATADGIPGRLAMVLSNLGPRGLTAEEATANLAASAAADGSAPRGTFWFMVSGDAYRTGPRAPLFRMAAKALVDLGFAAEVINGGLPPREAQVAGAVIGLASFNWPGSGAHMLPGAWCDHLTSFGGMMEGNAGQTPCTAFLRAGAAGSGGTVTEPLNPPHKFPSPFIHLHRVRGLTLVESLYLGLPCAYQYLALGDPLSRPWPPARPVKDSP